MSYIGNPIVSTDFPVDYFSGNGSTTAFTLSVAPASVNSIDVQVSGVSQSPQTYSVSGTTLTFSTAPPTGSSNIVVRHLGIAGIPNTPSAASVSYSSLDSSLQNRFDNSNKIINGCMRIDQRNAGASVTPIDSQYVVDRWRASLTQTSKFTLQQNAGGVTPPPGFTNYLGATSSSAYSLGAGDIFGFLQFIEGNNIADLAFGTANARPVTLSFWVRSSLTGTFSGALYNGVPDYSYPFTYSIPVANTWTQIFITVPGPTAGTWATNNTAGLGVYFCLGTGSTYGGTAGSWTSGLKLGVTSATSIVGTSGATFYITGVDLRKGSYSTAPTFNMRQYGQELALCQRYYYRMVCSTQGYTNFGIGYATGTTNAYVQIKNPVPMRALPYGMDISSAATLSYGYGTSPTVSTNALGIDVSVVQVTGTGMASGYAVALFGNNNTGAYIGFTAEL